MSSEKRLIQVLADLLDVDEASLGAEQPLATLDGWDSVNALRVLVYLERELGLAIDYERFMGAERVGDLLAAAAARPDGDAPERLAS